jgi:methylphosphotriester-DNA--protein-cysteine methyltransferase
MANNRDLLKEAIADAKAVKETAIANAKAALEESFGPFLREKLSQKISEMEETDEGMMTYANQEMEEEMDEVSLDELLAELEENEVEEELYEAKKEEKEEKEEEEEMSIEDMSEDDLKSFIENVIQDMIGAGELEAGHEGMENEEGAEELDERNMYSKKNTTKMKNYESLEEIDLNELLNELELEEETLNEMASFYKIKASVDQEKAKSIFKRAADVTPEGSAMHDILSSLAKTGEADLKKFSMEQGGKDMAKWNNVPNRKKLEGDGFFAKYLDAGSSPSNKGGQGKKGGVDRYDFLKGEEGEEEFTQDLEESTLNEMASFYKIKASVDQEKAKSIFKRAADVTPEGSAMHDILSSLAKTGEADLKKFSMEQGGKDMAKWNNVPNRKKLEGDGFFAKYLDAGSSPSNKGGQGKKGGVDRYDFLKGEEGEEEFTQDLEEAYSVIETLKSELNEINVLNAKLLYTNKIFRNKSLTESQKIKVLTAFDKATTKKEVELIYETLQGGLKASIATKSPIRESLGSASKALGNASVKPIIENDAFSRMRELAFGKK